MSFTGRDYQEAFDEACRELAQTKDEDIIRAKLSWLEMTLWEAIRGALAMGCSLSSALVVLPLTYLAKPETWVGYCLGVVGWLLLSAGLFGVLRLLLWSEVTRHITGRKFGHLYIAEKTNAT
ncbi:MAG: hypothetical protein CML29_05070 [Rhizobiales bacterium]|nr:hypothetical protein [Hyphomicrobiales bacterium]MBA71026.1 hypothetical protein [Hyphomicrobiales bacterium]|tara:strand:- start:833 stop:1198 length:366 start_codon:yes stop_codon:yes gene_type:complete